MCVLFILFIVYVCFTWYSPPSLSSELLKRLDDTDAEVRHSAAAAFPALVSALGPDYCGQQWHGHVEYFAKTLLVFLDDVDEKLQQLALGEETLRCGETFTL